jgi:hypothetical protein
MKESIPSQRTVENLTSLLRESLLKAIEWHAKYSLVQVTGLEQVDNNGISFSYTWTANSSRYDPIFHDIIVQPWSSSFSD